MVSKMCRGYLTAGMLAIGVTVVLISEIDTYCHTLSAWIWYSLSVPSYKKMLQMEDYQGTKFGRQIERFCSCLVLWKALIFSQGHECFVYRLRTGLKSTWIYRSVLKNPWKLNLPWKVLEKHSKTLKSPWILSITGGFNSVFGSDFRLYDGADLKTYLLMRW